MSRSEVLYLNYSYLPLEEYVDHRYSARNTWRRFLAWYMRASLLSSVISKEVKAGNNLAQDRVLR